MASAITEHIETTPGVCGGRPRIAGHRIRVQDIVVWHEHLGMSPDEIVSQHSGITLADVYAALAYYHDHLDEIRRDMDSDEAFARSVRSTTPSKLLQRLTRHDGGSGCVSPG
jgi:uncharacterized protein (DUF433 family)